MTRIRTAGGNGGHGGILMSFDEFTNNGQIVPIKNQFKKWISYFTIK